MASLYNFIDLAHNFIYLTSVNFYGRLSLICLILTHKNLTFFSKSLAATLLKYGSALFEGIGKAGNSLKPNLDLKIKTIQGTMRSFDKIENAIVSVVIQILS